MSVSGYYKYAAVIIILVLLARPHPLSGQAEQKYFGQNKVQYQNYDWKYIQSEHFDVYFYKGGDKLARFTADVAETALVKIREDFRQYELQNRIAIIVYNSHNQFQQTNVLDEYMPEGVGGVTELLKNRIVIPYEGSYEQFRHVIHHELTHGVMNDYMYGGSLQSMITGRIRVQIPLWVAEGYAEYSSRAEQFFTQSDMFVRDAVIEGYLPKLEDMGGYAVYVAGPTVFRYIEERYGKEKVSEFITKLRIAGSANAAVESAFGMKLEELSEKWAVYQRKIYYPDIAAMESVKETGKQLTRHDQDENFYNITPTISPAGDKIAYLTDKSGYADIMLISSIDGKPIKKLVSGEKTPDLEELHWLSPGMSWSPDGKRLVFSAKASDNDALLIVHTENGSIERFKWKELEGVFGGSWSPDGRYIAFTGMRYGQSDIYILDLQTREIRKITDDIYSDSEPSFSHDGKRIAFISDRGENLKAPTGKIKKADYDFRQTDIYIMNTDGSGLERITEDPMNDEWPQWAPDDSKLLFVSDRNGVSNLYITDIKTRKTYAITNVLSGVFQPTLSQDGMILAFSGFNKSGFDIFTLKKPFERDAVEPPLTVSMKRYLNYLSKAPKPVKAITADTSVADTSRVLPAGDAYSGVIFSDGQTATGDSGKTEPLTKSFRNFVFTGYDTDTSNIEDENEPVKLSKTTYLNSEGDYRIRKYKVKFTPDIFYGAAGFNTLTGFEGTTQLSFSDILGNHRMMFGTNLFFDLKNSSFSGAYYYLSRRQDFGIMGFHTAFSFLTDYVYELNGQVIPGYSDGYTDSWVRYRYYGISLMATQPINKFNRFDFAVTQLTLSRETSLASDLAPYLRKSEIPGLGPSRSSKNTLLSASFVTDNALNTYFGPFDGRRAELNVTASPGYGRDGLRFLTVTTDIRKYFWFKKYYAVSTRFSTGGTFGRNPQRFFVGGMDNWIAPSFNNGDIIVDTFEDFLATFVTPVRGSYYYELQGTRYAIANLELRFPLIYFIQTGFPLPLFLQQIRGVIFTDIGAAWGGKDREYRDPLTGQLMGTANYRYLDRTGAIIYNKSKFNWTYINRFGESVFQDVRIGYGFGIRGFIGIFVLRYDLAWNIMNPRFNGGDAKHYFSIGSDF